MAGCGLWVGGQAHAQRGRSCAQQGGCGQQQAAQCRGAAPSLQQARLLPALCHGGCWCTARSRGGPQMKLRRPQKMQARAHKWTHTQALCHGGCWCTARSCGDPQMKLRHPRELQARAHNWTHLGSVPRRLQVHSTPSVRAEAHRCCGTRKSCRHARTMGHPPTRTMPHLQAGPQHELVLPLVHAHAAGA